jgi:hypothetical protein
MISHVRREGGHQTPLHMLHSKLLSLGAIILLLLREEGARSDVKL